MLEPSNAPRPKALLPSPFQSSIETCNSIFQAPKPLQAEFPPWYDGSTLNTFKNFEHYSEDYFSKLQIQQYQVPAQPNSFQRVSGQNGGHFYCEMCDRAFADATLLALHNAEHIQCKIDGCKFTAHPKVVAMHRKHQHETGFAKKIMQLSDPEEIKKWRDERKKNYPTAENIMRKKAQIEEKTKRGELLETKTFGKMGRNRRGNQSGFYSQKTEMADNSTSFQEDATNQQGQSRRGRGWRFQRNQRPGRGGRQNSFRRDSGRESGNAEATTFRETKSEIKPKFHNVKQKSKELKRKLTEFKGILACYDNETTANNSKMPVAVVEGSANEMQPINSKKQKCLDKTDEQIKDQDISICAQTEIDNQKETEELNNLTLDQKCSEENAITCLNRSSLSFEEIKPPQKIPEGEINTQIPNSLREEDSELLQRPISEFDNETEMDKENDDNINSKPQEIPDSSVNFFQTCDNDGSEDETSKIPVQEEKETSNITGALATLMQSYGDSSSDDDSPVEVSSKIPINPPKRKCPVPNLYPIRRRRLTLLERLLANEIRHERNIILQCVHHIVKSKILK